MVTKKTWLFVLVSVLLFWVAYGLGGYAAAYGLMAGEAAVLAVFAWRLS